MNTLDENTKKQLKENFDSIDQNGDGLINFSRLKDLMKNCDIECTDEELQDLINDVDLNEKGQIDYNNFLHIAEKKLKDIDTEEDLKEFFDKIDKNKNGFISHKNLFDVISQIDKNLEEEEILQMVKENDLDNDGFLNYTEFCRMVKNK